MALVSCPDCEAKVSDLAKACTKCGFPAPFIKKQYCSECGNEIVSGADCSECGHPISPMNVSLDSGRNIASVSSSSIIDSQLKDVTESVYKELINGILNGNINDLRGILSKYAVDINIANTKDMKFELPLRAIYRQYETLLHFAARYARVEVLDFLIEAGADVSAMNQTAHIGTPLFYAADSERHADLKIASLLRAGASVNKKVNGGMTALHFAALDGDSFSVQALIDAGAEINALADGMGTPLMQAAKGSPDEGSAIKKIETLVNAGAFVNAIYKEGAIEYTALMFAIGNKNNRIADALKKLGAKISIGQRLVISLGI